MATLPRELRRCPTSSRPAGLLVAVVAVAMVGCTGTRYRATELPAEFLAPVTQNVQEIALSRLASRPVQADLIHRGDVLKIETDSPVGDREPVQRTVRVAMDGTVRLWPIDKVYVADMSVEAAEAALQEAGVAQQVYVPHRPPSITVQIEKKRTNAVQVIGAVEEQKWVEVPRARSDVMTAIMLAGGLSKDAGQEAEIRRTGQPMMPPQPPPLPGSENRFASHEQPVSSGPLPGSVTLIHLGTGEIRGPGGTYVNDGDTIIVRKQVPKPISVLGLVRKPGEYEMPPNQNLYLLDALGKAEDRSMQLADKVIIRRRVPGRAEPIVIAASIREAMESEKANALLAPGDVITVEDTPLTFIVRSLREITRVTVGGAVSAF